MKILVTGAQGFIAKNLIEELKTQGYVDILEYSRTDNLSILSDYCKEAAFVFHLAGVNRPKDQEDYIKGNINFTATLLDMLKKHNNICPIMSASSIQVSIDNLYGKSKKSGENLLFNYAKTTGAKVLIYRFPNVFGKWCRPNYNSALATFCHNVANDLPIVVNDRNTSMTLVYIDDVVQELMNALQGNEHRNGDVCEVFEVYSITLGEIVDLIYSFKDSREKRSIPCMIDAFTKKLYSTYLSYLPANQFSYPLKMNMDNRGSFTEFIKTPDRGQVSVNISKPGIIKGNHWHHTKNEKFLVVSGNGVIRFRKVGSDEISSYYVSGEKLEVVDIPPGYTHNIENLGDTDLVTIMWANESFDPNKPDTYFLEV